MLSHLRLLHATTWPRYPCQPPFHAPSLDVVSLTDRRFRRASPPAGAPATMDESPGARSGRLGSMEESEMNAHERLQRTRAGSIRRCVAGMALLALVISAIVQRGPVAAVMPPPAGFCASVGSSGSGSPYAIGLFTDRLEQMDPWPGGGLGSSSCGGSNRPHIVTVGDATAAPVPAVTGPGTPRALPLTAVWQTTTQRSQMSLRFEKGSHTVGAW